MKAGSVFSDVISNVALLAVIFGPLAVYYRRELRDWWRREVMQR